jgi:hypothetical protein
METTNTKSPYLDYEAASRYCNLHRVTLWRAAFRDGTLKASGPGRAVRFHVKDLDQFMASRHRK